MSLNLDVLRAEILDYLHEKKMAVFHGLSRTPDLAGDAMYWDVTREPDYRQFVEAAEMAGVRMMIFHPQTLSAETLEDAFERLKEGDFDRTEQRDYERRLREFRKYEGFTCSIELSFDYSHRVYVLDLHADWYDEFQDLMDELEVFLPEDGGPSLGGFFSQN
jgi:hypothetical protein